MVRFLEIAVVVLAIFGTIGIVAGSPASYPSNNGTVYEPTEAELGRISHLLELAKVGKYPGTNRVRPGKRGGTVPVWCQRTAMLHYNRRQVGAPLMWLTLAMGEVKNSKTVISNKKTWMKVWEEAHPAQFERMQKVRWEERGSFDGTI